MNDSDQLTEVKLSSKEIYNGVLLHVFSDEVRLPNGSTSVREWIKHPGASAVVPLFDDGDTMLIKQFRYPLRKVFYEVPAGKIDQGESPENTARRELKEETGIIFDGLVSLGDFHPSIGYTNEVIHLYFARDAQLAKSNVDEDEFLITQKLPFKKAVEMVYSSEITDGKTIAALLRAEHWLKQQED